MSYKGVYIIAEAGVNHNGDSDLAFELIKSGAEANADAVKFQTFSAKNLVTTQAKKAEYQMQTTDSQESQIDMLQRLELPFETFVALKAYCEDQGVEFISTPFDRESLRFLVEELGVRTLKISSGDLTNIPLLIDFARSGLDVILSTGMGTLSDIDLALGGLAFGYLTNNIPKSEIDLIEARYSREGDTVLKQKVTILHCTTEYPTPLDQVNLRAMDLISDTFGIPVGYSDHTMGEDVSVAAVARGAVVIEKHFTLNREMEGPDHRASLEPRELSSMIRRIRDVELSLGERIKGPATVEMKNMAVARKSIVATKMIAKGDIFEHENIGIMRPGNGIPPSNIWRMLGTESPKDYEPGDLI